MVAVVAMVAIFLLDRDGLQAAVTVLCICAVLSLLAGIVLWAFRRTLDD